jgi:hypothetical protein
MAYRGKIKDRKSLQIKNCIASPPTATRNQNIEALDWNVTPQTVSR